VLTLVVLFHILRAITVQKLSVIQLKGADLAEFSGKKPGKYSLPQKAMHLAWMLTILVAIATGIVMMVKAGTPVFHRNPYILTVKAWGILTLLHDLAALAALFLILVHVYFGLLPEKRMYLRSMVGGWMSRSELALNHDPERVARGE
jgi:cytochrome b subunit of formate dehydrogenase